MSNNKSIIYPARLNNLVFVELGLLYPNLDINSQDENGKTALMYAATFIDNINFLSP